MSTATIPIEHLIEAISQAKGLDELCDDCPAASWFLGTRSDLDGPGLQGEFDCPAQGNHASAACVRRAEIMEDELIIARAQHLQAEAEYEDPEVQVEQVEQEGSEAA